MIKNNSIKTFLFFIFNLSFSGCATYFNDANQDVTIYIKPERSLVVFNGDTSNSNPAIIRLPRSSGDVELQIISGEHKKKVILESSLSNEFYFGNIIFLGDAHIIDYYLSKDTKINSYDDEIFVDMNDTLNNYFRWGFPENNYHKFAVRFSFPEGNFHKLNTQSVKNSTVGFQGITGELDYHYSNNRFLSFTTGIALDIPPVPAAYDPPDTTFSISTLFISFQNHHDFDTWELGYGLSCSRYFYQERNGDSYFSKRFSGVGLSLSASRRIFQIMQIGINYLPTLMFFEQRREFGYSHLVYFELKFNLFEY